MDMGALFVAANCLKLGNDNQPDTSVSYKIQYSSTDDDVNPISVLSPGEITVHPSYNPDTLENNIAVILYSIGPTDEYVGYVSTEDYIGGNDVYVRQDYNMQNSSWNSPVVENQSSDSNGCADGSALYAANTEWMSCTSAVTTSSVDSDCYIPYGVMFKENSTDLIVLSSIYSHSVIYGSDMCTQSDTILNYYTMLWPYVGFARTVMGRGVSVYNQTTGSQSNDMTINSMVSPNSTSVPNTTTEGGDLYPKQLSIEASQSQEAALSKTDSSNDSSQATTSSGDSSNGLSKAQKIAIGVAVPLGVILVALGGIIVHHIWKVRREDKAWDPNAQSLNLQHAAMEISADDPFVVPPPYSQVNSAPAAIPQHPEVVDVKK
ncbi:hypothetical protein EV175_004619 [Coemansia sp. RSA 1933]|nr:hypothetical protein EV175_004619 [Coemansia sp. RSA 1933]